MTRPWAPAVDGLAQLVEHELHGGGLDSGQDQGDAGVALRADRAEQIDGLVAQVAAAAGPLPLLEPSSAGPPGLADSGLVEEPDLEPLGLGMGRSQLGDQRQEFFLKVCWAFGSACGCTGRVFCQDRPRSCSSRSMPFSL